MARHLESSHENKSDVARALSFPKGSKERKNQLDYIRNRGNYAHNAAVMESGKGELVPFKRPQLLVKQREACGVLKDNAYMFARPEAMTHFRGAEHDRHRDGQLANFLGHDIRIHREFYRLPEKTLQLAKISKVLMALEQGRLAEFHGKNLDEIGIDPDEKVVDCDEEEQVNDCDEEDRSIQEGHCSSTVDASAEVALPATERNMSHKRGKPSSEVPMSSGASAMRPPCKGKSSQKKAPWQQAEVQAVERHLKSFIISGTVPAKSDCEKCLKAEPQALRNRDWKTVKFYVYNRITAFKKKLQCR
ncbi:uncharacterized protein LOC113100254 [Carassius auratus]|uniref:Uncharacterized protein LOC113100254 n=1 Tax=Carassius auratus TaxID=7957 RepID=A0A6P6PI62_CARAU|nr:uncharacterized protein LOC113100254 [Carassius auratus]